MAPEIIIAISSTIIALCALCLSCWQAHLLLKHNKISVKPHLTTWFSSDYINKKYEVSIINNGIGPALIKEFVVKVDNTIITGEPDELIGKALKLIFPDQPFNSFTEWVSPGHVMGAKDSFKLVTIEFLEGCNLSKEQIDRDFERGDILIKYESFYKEQFIFDSQIEKLNK